MSGKKPEEPAIQDLGATKERLYQLAEEVNQALAEGKMPEAKAKVAELYNELFPDQLDRMRLWAISHEIQSFLNNAKEAVRELDEELELPKDKTK